MTCVCECLDKAPVKTSEVQTEEGMCMSFSKCLDYGEIGLLHRMLYLLLLLLVCLL